MIFASAFAPLRKLKWRPSDFSYHATKGHVVYRLVSCGNGSGRPLSWSHSRGGATEVTLVQLSVERGRCSHVERFASSSSSSSGQTQLSLSAAASKNPKIDYNRQNTTSINT